MRAVPTFMLAATLAVCAALLVTGCPKETPEATDVPVSVAEEPEPEAAQPGEETEDQKLARGREVMAQYEDATEPPVDWTWNKDTPIDPASVPDEPAAGVMEGKVFRVRHAVMQQDPEEGTWELRFLDVEPTAGEEHSFSSPGTHRYLKLTIPEAAKGVKIEAPFGSDNWKIDKLWFLYFTPHADYPDGTTVNPAKSVALYLEFTDWDQRPSPENENVIGIAKGRIGVGSWMTGFQALCWLAGNFEAVIAKP